MRVWTDSTATIGICGRQGLGKLRHIDTQCLWIQQKVRGKALDLFKVRGEENPADLFTKHLVGRDRIHSLLALFGCEYRGGRARAAPHVRSTVGTTKGELLALKAHVVMPLEWDGHLFETALDSDDRLPEAYPAMEGLLPHEHADVLQRFPKAVACPEPLDQDPPADDRLEVRGRVIGERVVRFADTVPHTAARDGKTRPQRP